MLEKSECPMICSVLEKSESCCRCLNIPPAKTESSTVRVSEIRSSGNKKGYFDYRSLVLAGCSLNGEDSDESIFTRVEIGDLSERPLGGDQTVLAQQYNITNLEIPGRDMPLGELSETCKIVS